MANEQNPTYKPIYTPNGVITPKEQKTAQDAPETDLYRRLDEWIANNDKDGGTYLKGRGISIYTQRRFKVGLAYNWSHPKTGTFGPSKRCIIPTGADSYLARAIDPQEQKQKPKAGKASIFNMKAVLRAAKASKPVFIVEGEIDAMSLEEVEANAVGLGSISYVPRFFDALDAMAKELGRIRPGFVICMDQEDNKEQVRRAAALLGEGLEKRGFVAVIAPPFPTIDGKREKDANALLQKSPEALATWAGDAGAFLNEAEEEYKETWLKEFRGGFDEFRRNQAENKNFKPLDTGFYELDEALGGGIYNGLYVLGAVPSLGKTTLALQIADHIAGDKSTNGQQKEPRPVLFFALEMSRDEMIAKSLARMSSQAAEEKGLALKNGIPKNAILRGGYSGNRGGLVLSAMVEYERILQNNICFIEGVGDISAREIRGKVEKFTQINQVPPVVFVDYLQIMAAEKEGMLDKQIVDKNVLELKRISRDFKTPVIIISNLNREAYNKPIKMSSFKETGAIEYTADALIGLQFDGVSDDPKNAFNDHEAKARRADNDPELNERLIDCVILKNRNGVGGGKVKFRYYPAHDYFKAHEEGPDVF